MGSIDAWYMNKMLFINRLFRIYTLLVAVKEQDVKKEKRQACTGSESHLLRLRQGYCFNKSHPARPGACHTGHRSCFFTDITGEETAQKVFSETEVYGKK